MTKRWPTILALTLAIVVAFYTGFRLPNAWVATQGSVSLFDGFFRRFGVGTLLHPLASLTHYNYWLFATYGLLLLAGVLVVLVLAAWRAKLATRRWLIITWLFLPTGGFLFHEAGYFEQVNYLLLFASIALVQRNRLIAATALMSLTPLCHEISIVTCTPLFGLYALRTLPFRRAVLITAIPAAVALLVMLVLPGATQGAHATLMAKLASANFPLRTDAVPGPGSVGVYHNHEVVEYVVPLAGFLMLMFGLLWRADGKLYRARDGMPEIAVMIASIAAVGLPCILIWAGWDANRWAFLLITNFFVATWISLDGRDDELNRRALAVLAVTVLVLAHFTLFYFDRFMPRNLDYDSVKTFAHELRDGSLLQIPVR